MVLRIDRIELVGLARRPDRPRASSSSTSSSSSTGSWRSSTPTGSPTTSTPRTRRATGGSGRRGSVRNPLSVAGLLAVVLVMAGSHVVVARYDMLAQDVLDSGCIFISDATEDVRPATRRRRPAAPAPTPRRERRAAEPDRLARPPSRRPSGAPCPRSRSRRGTARSG